MNRFLLNIKSEDNSNRIEILDFVKGGAVLMVLLHHSGIPCGKYILAFHIPLFFILSGYLYQCTNSISRDKFNFWIKKKAKKLLIPYIVFELINLLLSLAVVNKDINLADAFKSIFLCINSNGYQGITLRLWFFPCMFVSDMIFYWTVRIIKKKEGGITPVIFFVLSKVIDILCPFRLPFTLDISVMAVGFMLCGYFWGPLVYKYKKIIDKKEELFLMLVITVFFIISSFFNDSLLMFIDEYGNYLEAIVSSLTGSLFFIWILNKIQIIRKIDIIYNYIIFLGKNSLFFFPVHLILLFGVEKIMLRIGIYGWWIKALIVGMICVPVINIVVMIYNVVNNHLREVSKILRMHVV